MIDLEERFDTIDEMEAFLKRIAPTNIYDDVELLQSQVAALITEMSTKLSDVVTNLNGADLNEVIGKIIIGYDNNCVNRPTGQNGYLINIPHADSPGNYNKQIWFTRPANNVFVRSMEDGIFGEWTPIRFDGGWHALSLANGVTQQNASEYPCRFRKINNRVYIEGCVKGLVTSSQIVCTLPEEYRPVQRYYFQAPTNSGGTDTYRVNLDGTIDWAATTGAINANNWHFITTSFLVN